LTFLLDGNVLIALTVVDHVHHDQVADWFARHRSRFATTPITQGTLLRFLVRDGVDPATALLTLDGLTTHRRHEFWEDSILFSTTVLRGVIGHRQITVNSVLPGAVNTDALKERPGSETFVAAEIAQTPLGRLGEPQDIADVVAFLVSEDGRWLTGQTIGAGGGMF